MGGMWVKDFKAGGLVRGDRERKRVSLGWARVKPEHD